MEVAEQHMENSVASPNYLRDNVLYGHGFTETEIDYAMAHANIDWYDAALQYANQYLANWAPVTRYDLKMQFMDTGFSDDEITYAMDYCDADFYNWCLDRAQELVNNIGISADYLAYALEMEGYYFEEVVYAVANVTADWEQEAVEKAYDYLDMYPECSHEELYNYLTGDQMFTAYQANNACSVVGK